MELFKKISLLFFAFYFSNAIAIQNDTIINVYSEVTAIFNNDTSNTDSLLVKDPEKFKKGDTIIIYQAKGVEWDYGKGAVLNYNFAGRFEYHIIFNKSATGDTIILDQRLSVQNTFKFQKEHLVQIIKVPSIKKYVANKTLNAFPWDGAKGGIFAMIVDTLELKSDIDVTGTGFRGGDPSKDTSKGYCINSTIDTLDFLEPNYPFSAKDTAGLKGESVVVFDSLYMRGLKYLYNGGGGGPGYHSGGGGGGNFGSGGSGGGQACKCYPNCADSLINTKMLALGGYRLDGGLLDLGDVRAVFGGGGGCGTRAIITDTSKAGNGGGIVLLIANVVKGNGHSIKADGQTVTDISIIGGGGGGGGGAVLLDVNNFEGKLTVSVKGGSGGWTEGSTDAGPGGGGGCGYIWYNGTTIPPSDSITNSYYPGGSSGKNLYFRTTRWASPGEYGTIKGNLIMPLSNFLFNLMPSDTIICAGDVPHVFNASHPKGGDGNYKYTWLKSTDKLHFSIIPDAVSMTYQETALFDTTYYLRIVRVLNPYFGDTIVDQSQDTLKVFVLPVIDNNKIFSSDTAKCYGIPLPNLTGTFPFGTDTMKLSGGNGSYIYQWQVYNSNWISAPNDSNKINYSPKQTYSIKVRRFIKSSACNSISNSINLTVLPAITNNVIANTQWICKGSLKPDSLFGINPIGGGDTIHHQYIYLWQGSSNNFSSVDTSLTQSGAKYHFSKALPDTMYYRRIVFSGQLNTCKDTSNILAINILDSIENNFIHEVDTVICGNTRPKDFFGDLPTGGDKKYRYQWDSITTSKPWSLIRIIPDTLTFNPGIMYETTWFRRIVLSGPNNACKDTSSTMKLAVRPYIKNNFIINPDTTICYNQSPGIILADPAYDGDGPFKYTWLVSNNNLVWTITSGIDTLDYYKTGFLIDTSYFRRKISSGVCTDSGKIIKVAVLPLIGENIIGPDFSVCKGSKPDTLKGHQPSGGDNPNYNYLWLAGNDSVNITDIGINNINSFYISDTQSNIKYFKRVVKSGLHDCCIDTSNLLKIGINELPIGALAYFNDSICLGNDYTISFAFTGKGNFDFTYSDNKDTSEVKDAAGDYKLDLKPGSAGIYIYKILSLTDGNNCVAKELGSEDSLSVFKIPDAKAGTDTSVCGLKVQLNATPSIGLGSWSADVPATFFASAAISNPIATVNNNNYGHHYFTWTENNGGCSDKDSIEITFFEQPTSGDAGKDTTYPYLFQVKLQALEPALGKGSWSSPDKSLYFENDSDPSTFVDSLKFGKNYLIWTVVNGVCNAIKDTVVVEVKDLRIPQGFSPNGDGINDKFEIPGIENLRGKNAELIIINKWGAEVYHDTNYKGDWDGTHDGTPLPSDTYYYILRVIGRTYKGFLIIRR